MRSTIYSRINEDENFRLGYYHHMSGDLESAAEYYIRSIERTPSAEAHTFLGWILNQFGESEAAIHECEKALEIDPQFGNALNDLGAYYLEKKQTNRAVQLFKKACRSKNYDNQEFSHYNLARAYIQLGYLLWAKEQLQKALLLNPQFTPAKELSERLENKIQ